MIPLVLFGIITLLWIVYVGWFIYKYTQHVRAELQEQITWRDHRATAWEERKKTWRL